MDQQQEYDGGLLLDDEQKMEDIEQPHHHDVLCGRGVTTNRHPGNESFRSLVGLNKELYVSSTKRQKMSISRSIVEAVRSLDPPGRFLEKDPDTGLWADIGHKKAVEKTSQALRDGAASLRKQLSADLGDPDFLNAVFEDHEPGQRSKADSAKKSNDDEKDGSAEEAKASSDDRMDTDDASSGKKPFEKIKVIKKSKHNSVKKGHRRTRSNPGSGTASTRQHRRVWPTEPPPSPLAQFAERYTQVPPSPRTPQPRQAMSHPNSPMTWGGTVSYHEHESPGSMGPSPTYSGYEHPSPSPGSFSPYARQSGDRHYGRSHSYEYPYDSASEGRSPHHHSHPGSWSYSASRYQPSPYRERLPLPPAGSSASGSGLQYSWKPPSPGQVHSGYPPAGSCASPRPPRSASPAPASPLPKGPLPPGRHQFSPAGYTSNPSGGEWQSPRDPLPRYERYPAHHGYHHESIGYPSDRSPRWRSPHSHEYYSTPPPAGYGTSFSSSAHGSESSGLSVPSLGGEGRPHPMSSMSSRVMLSPRSRASYGETPPRPPTSSSRDFAPPQPSPRFRRIRRREERYPHEWEREDSYRASPPGEEKKMDEDRLESTEESRVPYPSLAESSSQISLKLNPRKISSASHADDGKDEEGDENLVDRSTPVTARSSPVSIARASPVSARISIVVAGTEASAKVDEIAMSPIPFDREDPTTLMELPDNILTLPISPCGPNDDPWGQRS